MRRPSSKPATDLTVRLLWLTVFRVVVTTLIMVVLAAQLWSRRSASLSGADLTSFALIGTVYVLTLTTGLLLRRGRVGVGVAWVQVFFDIVLAAGTVFLTGGNESPFTFLFLLAIVGSSVLLGRLGAIWAASFSALAYGVVVGLVDHGRPLSTLLIEGAVQVVAQMLIAVLSGYVAEQLSSTGGQLSARVADLEQLTELKDRVVATIPSGLVTCDQAGVITFVNPAGLAILGVDREPRGEKIDALMPGVLRLRMSRRSELKVATGRGDRTLGLTITPLAGAADALLIVFQDLTELRRLERELERIDQLATLGRMSAQLAHEVRNPLASMRGSAQLLAEEIPEGSQQRLARLIVREADRLAQLVEAYLKLARPPPPQLATAHRLDLLVSETLEMLRSDPTFSTSFVEESLEPVSVPVDPDQIKQVLINLLRNAIAAAGQAGRVRVSVKASGSAAATIEVWDSAGSIAPGDQKRVFEPFFTTQVGGTGLGLSTAQSIVQAHGGSIVLESSPERGTSFLVHLGAQVPGTGPSPLPQPIGADDVARAGSR